MLRIRCQSLFSMLSRIKEGSEVTNVGKVFILIWNNYSYFFICNVGKKSITLKSIQIIWWWIVVDAQEFIWKRWKKFFQLIKFVVKSVRMRKHRNHFDKRNDFSLPYSVKAIWKWASVGLWLRRSCRVEASDHQHK